jgi:hypothetical protein
MDIINENLDVDCIEFKEKFTNNLLEFLNTIHNNLKNSQAIDYKKSKSYIVGPLTSALITQDLNKLEISVSFIYGNFFLEECVSQYVNEQNFYTDIHHEFNKSTYVQNILHSYEHFYLKQSYYTKRLIAQFFRSELDIDLENINYEQALKEYFPIYDKQQLEKQLVNEKHNQNKIKL